MLAAKRLPLSRTSTESQSRAELPVMDDDTRVSTHGLSRRESLEVQIAVLYQYLVWVVLLSLSKKTYLFVCDSISPFPGISFSIHVSINMDQPSDNVCIFRDLLIFN